MTIAWDPIETLLDGDIDDAATTLIVRHEEGWSAKLAAMPFDIAMGLEMMTVTARPSAKHWTVTRGVRGTTDDVSAHYDGATVAAIVHTFKITKGLRVIDLSAICRRARHTYAVNIGDRDASFEVETTAADIERWLPDKHAAVLMSSNETGTDVPYWSGFVGRVSYIERDDGGEDGTAPNSLVLTITARGFGNTANKERYIDTTAPDPGGFFPGVGWWRAGTPIHTVMQDARRDLCNEISNDDTHVIDGGQSLSKELNGIEKSAADLWNEMSSQGDTGEALDWAVYTDTDAAPKLWVYRRSRWPTYHIPYASVKLPQQVGLAWDEDDEVKKVIVKFNGGMAIADSGVLGGKTIIQDLRNTIDDLGTANYIAKAILGGASSLQMATEGPITLEYKNDDPATKYLTDSLGNEIALWRFRAGYLAVFDDLVSHGSDYPITPIQAKVIDVDHYAHTVSAQMGVYWDISKIANMYGVQQAKLPDSPTHQPGSSGTSAAPPANDPQPGSLSPSIAGLGAFGGIGYNQVAKDGDIIGWDYALTTDADEITTGRKPDLPIPLAGQIVGFWLGARDSSEPSGAVSVSLNIGHATKASYPSVGTAIWTLAISSANQMSLDLDPDQTAPVGTRMLTVNPGDYLSITVNSEVACQQLTLRVLFRRTQGSDRVVSVVAPNVTGLSASRGDNNLTTFTINADRAIYAQIEYGLDDTYHSWSARSELIKDHPEIVIAGLPTDTLHWRAHLWDADGNETISDDQVL